MARNNKTVLVAQPTIDLIDKTVSDELPKHLNRPRHKTIHGGVIDKGTNVARELAAYLRNGDTDGTIIFTTHQVLQFLASDVKTSNVHLLIDECPQVSAYDAYQLPATHSLITDDITLKPFNAIYGKVDVKNKTSLADKARNKGKDTLLEKMQGTLHILNNDNWANFVNSEQYQKLLDGRDGLLAFHSLLKPSIFDGFGSVFMAGACFEDSGVYRLWSEVGVEFVSDKKFASSLSFDTHENGKSIKIYYVTKENWSKRLRTKELDDGAVVQGLYVDSAKMLFGTDQFLWQANKEYTADPFGSQATRLPNMPHGLNTFSHLHDFVFLSSLNPSPDHIRFMKDQGLSEDQIRASTYYSTAYQAIMRTSIRSRNDANQKRIIVPDLGLAEYLQQQFPGSAVELLDAGLPEVLKAGRGGRPRKHVSNASKRRAQRSNAKEKEVQLLRDVLNVNKVPHDTKEDCGVVNRDTGVETGIEITTSIDTDDRFFGSLFKTKKSKYALGFLSCNTADDLVLVMEQFHTRKLGRKDDNFLISPARFAPSLLSEKARGIENVVYCRHLFLDFEDGDLKPDELPNLFPQYKMLVTNTHSHTAENPRFRVIIPTSQPVTAYDQEILFDQIVAKLEESGYDISSGKRTRWTNTLRSGLDKQKRTATSLFYAPIQAVNLTDSFFHYYNSPDRELLDPMQWIENAVIPIQPDFTPCVDADRPNAPDQAAVNNAVAEWQSCPKGTGNGEFFRFGQKLYRAGMDFEAIEQTLHQQSRFATPGSKSDRKRQIPSVVASLRKWTIEV